MSDTGNEKVYTLNDFQASITPCGRVGIIIDKEAAGHLMAMLLHGIPWGIPGETPRVSRFSHTAMLLFDALDHAGIRETAIWPAVKHFNDIWKEGY